MPKSNAAIILSEGDGATDLSPLEAARVKADAMLRAALECCHQHDRYARLVSHPALEAEHHAADEMCIVVAKQLDEVAEIYHQGAADLHPNGGPDEDWWHRANKLWHASREFARRQREVKRPSSRAAKHSPDALSDLVVQYDLEASSLLALRQAADAYRKLRPEAA